MSTTPIADYALLSDCNSAALVDRTGSVDWLPLPRFDGPSIFGRLLDDTAGHFSVRPTSFDRVERSYVDPTLVLETVFHAESGELALQDALAMGPNDEGHDLGAHSPRVLLRAARCTRGEIELQVEYAPRPEYGLVRPLLRLIDGGVLARGGASVLLLSCAIPFRIGDATAHARLRLRAGDELLLAVQHRSSTEPPPRTYTPEQIRAGLEDTLRAWQSWSKLHQRYTGPWSALVDHSGRVLQGLTYYPTGAIVAAATTSLPETVGGPRNWDYRYSWVRDASLTLDALWVAACPDESHKFFDFMADAALSQLHLGDDMQIMYGIGGEHDLSERELAHLSGWRGARPVRVGNGAWHQRQIDVYGELLDAALRLRDHLTHLDPVSRRFLAEVADAAARHWEEPDQGIWEIRGPPRHYLYSKLMCWVALDRAIALAHAIEATDRVQRWISSREAIREAIMTHGFSERLGAFTRAFDEDALDAANLMMPIVGFLPARDPRTLATLDAIERDLTDERGLLYRYRADDGLEGDEGTFLLCTFWLAQARAKAGQVERAREIFARAAAHVNDVGLLAEEVDPSTGELLGNFPQAFSHIGLVNASWAIAQAEATPSPGESP